MASRPKPKRVLLKLSGEALMGDQAFGIDDKTVSRFAAEIAEIARNGTEFALVIGGGNIFRGEITFLALDALTEPVGDEAGDPERRADIGLG